MTGHPSGRPIRERVVKGYAQPRGTQTGYIVARLNTDNPLAELAGGVGFIIHRDAEDVEGMQARKRKRGLN